MATNLEDKEDKEGILKNEGHHNVQTVNAKYYANLTCCADERSAGALKVLYMIHIRKHQIIEANLMSIMNL